MATRDAYSRKTEIQCLGHMSFSVSEPSMADTGNMSLLISIKTPPGWKLTSYEAGRFVYRRVTSDGYAGGVVFEITASTETDKM
jgi:hypothetical protein